MPKPLPIEELDRLAAVYRSGLLDGLSNPVLDDLAALASQLCQTPIALLTIIDERNQWFKASVGMDTESTSGRTAREVAICSHTIGGKELLEVSDTRLDPRFRENPLVTNKPHICFYAGYPIFTNDGFALGALCVIDRVPRKLTPFQEESLRRLAKYAESEIERRRLSALLTSTNVQLLEEISRRAQLERILREVIDINVRSSLENMGPEAVLETLLQKTQALAPSDGAILELRDPGGRGYHICSRAGKHVDPSASSLDAEFSASCLAAGRVIVCQDTAAGALPEIASYRAAGIGSILAAPVSLDGERTGVLTLLARAAQAFDTRQEQALDVISCFVAPLLSQAIDREARQRLMDERSQAVSSLREREQLFAAFMNHSPAAAYMKDAEGRLLFINAEIKKLWSVSDAEWIGKTDAELWPPAIARKLRETDCEVLRSWKDANVIEEVPLPNGEIRIFHSLKFPFRHMDGRVLLGGMSLDVTESKKAEARLVSALGEKNVLIKEVHHRVKNNLQVISSLLSIQARGVADENTKTLLQHNQSRVFAMALVHEELYKSEDLSRISMGQYLEQVLRYQSSIYGAHTSRIHVSFESAGELWLSADQAIPCGLIVNELISNSFKHAFRDRSGTIKVALRKQERHFTLRVQDNGTGLPKGFALGSTKSLGLEVVQILTRQLDGRLSVGAGGGACFELRVPLLPEPPSGA